MARKKKTPAASAPTHKVCPSCGAENPKDAAKCPMCGFDYGIPAPPKVLEEVWLTPEEMIEGSNSRVVAEPNYLDTITKRAISIAIEGQLNPAEGRRVDGTVILDAGHTRREAVRLLRTGFEAVNPVTGEKQLFHDPERKLWVRIMDTNAEQAFIRAIAENLERKDTTDYQEALAQEKLRSDYGWTDTKIARLYGYENQNRVMALKTLLTLDPKTQTLVHEGKLALYAALLTANPHISLAEREEMIKASTEGDRVRGEVLRGLVRELLESKAPPEAESIDGETKTDKDKVAPAVKGGGGADTTAKIKRSVKDFKNFVGELNDEYTESLDPSVLDLMNALVNFFDGKKGFSPVGVRNRLQNLKGR